MNRRWKASDVHPMESERVRFDHVARHLYQPKEEWNQVIPHLGDASGAALKAGCAEALLDAPHPDCDQALLSCRIHVLNDHDTLLRPAYLEELSRAEQVGHMGSLPKQPGRGPGWMFVGDRGVIVIVREVGSQHRPEVKTAYRVVPSGNRRPGDFLKKALEKLRDKTSWSDNG